ncbi:MAG: tryptophan-rich sensory protein [Longimicrobiales bacterium]|nr:tryptophan-rich sensory protein [Longimicrobiales bacterium]
MDKLATWVVFYLCTVVATSAGFVFPLGDTDPWFAALKDPWFAPPSWLFGPVWTILYLLIATSAYKLMYASDPGQKPLAISLWSLQLVLNVIWTPIFSGAQNLEVAFYYIIALWFSIIAYIAASSRVSAVAAALVIPYSMWVTFAAILNYNYWRLNS